MEPLTAQLVRKALASGSGLWIGVRSSSMKPLLAPGDQVWVAPLEGRPRPGDVLLYEGPAGLTLHRCLYLKKDKIRLKGDAAAALDPLIPLSAVLGRAVKARSSKGTERTLSRRGGYWGTLASLAPIAFRVLLRRIVGRQSSAFSASLGDFSFKVQAPGISRKLLGKWLHYESAQAEPLALRVSIDRTLDHTAPFAIEDEPGSPRKIFSSAFVLGEGTGGIDLRVAPDVHDVQLPCPNALENGLRALLALLCERTPGCTLLHAAAFALSAEGGAFVAPGASGTGKTTLCRMLHASGAPIAGDDLLLIRTDGARGWVSGTPFSGDGADIPKQPGPYPIQGWLLLEKAPTHNLSPAPKGRLTAAIAAALQRLGAAHRSLGGEEIDRAAELAALAPAYRLAFAPAPSVGQYLRDRFSQDGGVCE